MSKKDEVSKLSKLIQETKEKLEEVKKQKAALFNDVKNLLFEENPGLKSFGWDGYVPFFNDGSECTFSSNHEYPIINGFDYNRYAWEDDDLKDKDGLTEAQRGDLRDVVVEALSSFEEEIYQELFGNHFKVTFTIDKTEVEEYTDHE